MYESTDKMVSHPKHYQSEKGIELIDVIEAFTADLTGIEAVDTGHLIRYSCRWMNKNGIQDLEKLMWYCQHLIDHLREKEVEEEPMSEVEMKYDAETILNSGLCFDTCEKAEDIITRLGDIIEVYKSNQIIPQIKRNISAKNRIDTDYIIIPSKCPVCGGDAVIKETDNSKILVCTNPDCAAKKLANFTHFVSRECMDIKNLSEATLESFISLGFLHEYADIYRLKEHRGQMVLLDGFGAKSVDKLLNSIEESRHVKLENFINALGIPNIGLAAAKTISKFCEGDVLKFLNLWGEGFNWETLDDFGEVMAKSINQYLTHNYHQTVFLIQELEFELPEKIKVKDNPFAGKSLCVTGRLSHFTRSSINEKIASLGAKAVGSVSSKTDYLITNEASSSSKYKRAVELNINIITEDKFLKMIGE